MCRSLGIQVVLSFVLLSSVRSNIVVQVTYSTSTGGVYTATAVNQKVHTHASGNITFTGTHLTGMANTDVKAVLFDGGEIPSTIAQVFDAYPNVEQLTYSNNGLFHLKSGAFAKATKLKTLQITLNFLPVLHNHPFKGATALTSLILNRNKIHRVESTAFSDLSAITSIILSNNHIHRIDTTTFSGLTSLTTVDLTGNICPSQVFSAASVPIASLPAVIASCPSY